MRSYEIKIEIGRLLHYSEPLKSQMNNETLLMMIRSFSVYIKKMYISMISEAIYSRRYKGEWEPIDDKGYTEFIGTIPTTHILELMYEAIEVREIKQNIVVRFDPNFKYPGSSLTLLQVLNAIDNGTSKFNARPILKNIVRQLNSELISLWKVYLKKKGVI